MSGNEQAARLLGAVEPLKQTLDDHRLYDAIDDLPSLRRFMEVHVWAVWDFMVLLKSLQRRLTSVDAGWRPPADPKTARFINEIVLCEESDEVAPGRCLSHLQLYLAAMREVGADAGPMRDFLQDLAAGRSAEQALERPGVPHMARAFVGETLELSAAPLHVTAAAFCHGREDPIPRMFTQIIAVLEARRLHCPDFVLYLKRHCEVDGEEHGPMALRLLRKLCADDDVCWREARAGARRALEARLALWDALADSVQEQGAAAAP